MKKIFLFLALTVVSLAVVSLGFAVPQFAGPYDMGLIELDEITEASGLVASRQNSNVFWLHNDSGNESAIYAINRLGEHLGKYILTGITLRDAEDIAIGSGPVSGVSYLYLADIGDNGGIYAEKYIYRFAEPEVSSTQSPVEIQIDDLETITFRYPDDVNFDSETLLHDPNSNDLYLVTKRHSSDEADYVFCAAYPQSITTLITLEEVATLNYPDFNGYGTTAGDISVSGLEMILKTYSEIYYFSLEPNMEFSQIFNEEYIPITYSQEVQGEALAWQADGDGYFTVSEETLDIPAHLTFYPRVNNYITIPQLPTSLYLPNENFTISWEPQTLNCYLYYSGNPGSENIANYQNSGLNGDGSITSNPGNLGWNTGIYYCVLYNAEYGYVSTEFNIFVESAQAVDMINPANGSEVFNLTPVFSWEANSGVPYYFLTLSDQPFTISEDENGDPVVEGMQPIWQVITPNTSILYATPDPSGFFQSVAPPLIPDQEYYWIVANNYGNDPLLSSKVVSTPVSFTFRSSISIPDPELIFPENEVTINGAQITFRWSLVEEASLYYFTLYETREEEGSSGQYLIWQQTTTSNEITISAASMLFNNHYVWNIIASNGTDANSQSDTYGFYYDTAIGTIDIYVKNSEGAAVGYATVEMIPENGAYNIVPFAVNSGGHEVKIIAPGQYLLISSKEGYETTEIMVDIAIDSDPESPDGDTLINVIMEQSPSNINGFVVGSNNQLIEYVDIIADDLNGDLRQINTPTGNYQLGITAGNWEISAMKAGYSLAYPITINIFPGETQTLPDLILIANTTTISGITRNNLGNPLAAVQVIASGEGEQFSTTSNSSGSFFLEALPEGEWSISASKSGFISPSPQVITLNSFSPESILLPDFILDINSGIVSGNAGNGVVPLEGVSITALPETGNPQYTTTDSYGDFYFDLIPGNYLLLAQLLGYSGQNEIQISILPGQTIANLELILLPVDCAISGQVTSAGQGVQDVIISADEFSTLTNENGNYLLPVAQGSYQVTAVKNGYSASDPQQVSVSGGITAQGICFILTSNPSVISGTVLSANQIIAGATVKGLRLPNNNSITPILSDQSGDYQLNLIPGDYKIWAEKTGFITVSDDTLFITVQPVQNYPNQDLELSVYRTFVNGTTYGDDGSPLSNTFIIASQANSSNQNFYTFSDDFGSFNLMLIPGFVYQITAQQAGYDEIIQNTEVLISGETITFNFIMNMLPVSISGIISDQDGNPLSDASVVANGDEIYSTNSLYNGSYSVSLIPGLYTVSAGKLGYALVSQTIDVVVGCSVENLDFTLADNFGILEGYITDENLQPLPDVLISANLDAGDRNTSVSDENGFFSISRLLPGLYEEISFNKYGYEPLTITNIVVPPLIPVSMQVELVQQNAELTINALDNLDNPIAGASVIVENLSNGHTVSSVTNQSGSCTISALPALQLLQISVQKPGYYVLPNQIILDPNSSETMDIQLELVNGSIYGLVDEATRELIDRLSRDNRGIGGVQINALSADGFSGSTISQPNGEYQITNLAPFKIYEISVVVENYSLLENPVIYLSESEYFLNIELYPHSIVISGKVEDQHGNPLNNVLVSVLSQLIEINNITNNAGEFTLTGLAPNREYFISTGINAPGYDDAGVLFTTTTENENIGDLIVNIHQSILRGYVRDANTQELLSSASVSIVGAQSGFTDNYGYYVLRYLPEGSHILQIARDSYQTLSIPVQLSYWEDQELDIELQYSDPVSISGVVRDSSETIIPNAPINITFPGQLYSTTSNQNGEFVFTEVASYNDVNLGTNLPPELYDNCFINFTTENNDLAIDLIIDIHAAEISGIIKDEEQNPLADVEVILNCDDVNFVQLSDENGQFNFMNLYEGIYQINFSKPAYQDYEQNIVLEDFQIEILNPILTAFVGQISGRVKQIDNIFLENSLVELWQDQELISSDTTSISGIFTFDNLPQTENYHLVVRKTGYEIHNEIFDIIPGDPEFLIELVPLSNSVLGTIRYLDVPFENSVVLVRNTEGEDFSTVSDQFGDYVIGGLNGYYCIQAFSDSLISLSHPVFVEESGYQIDLELGLFAHIIGRVTYLDQGKPGVTISATNSITGNVYQNITDEQGYYDISGMPAGEYLIYIFLEGFTVNEPLPYVTTTVGEIVSLPDFTMSFQQNSITGSILEEIGRQEIDRQEIGRQEIDRQEIEDALVTLWQDGVIIDSTFSSGDGNYLFESLTDGNYQLQASHSAYIISDLMDVELIGGNSNPSVVDFYLTQLTYILYGLVRDEENVALSEATIYAISGEQEFVAYSEYNGQYSLQLPEQGIYNVSAEKEGYYSSAIFELEFSEMDNQHEQNFILAEIILTTTLQGSVLLENLDEGYTHPADSAELVLWQDGEEVSSLELISPDSTYLFNDLIIPGIYALEITAFYQEQEFYRYIPYLEALTIEPIIQDILFGYQEDAISLTGQIQMNHNGVFPLSLITLNLTGDEYNEIGYSNQNGFYEFPNLIPQDYMLFITADYDNEIFTAEYQLSWTGEDMIQNHTFFYHLAGLDFLIMQTQDLPIAEAIIKINGEAGNIEIMTNASGYASTGLILPTEVYYINIYREIGSLGSFINPGSFTMQLDSLITYSKQITLPLQYDTSQLNSVGALEDQTIVLNKTEEYNDNVYMTYQKIGTEPVQIIMQETGITTLTAEIPAWNSSGDAAFWFSSFDSNQQLSFTNEDTPFTYQITSAGLPSSTASSLIPQSFVIAYNQEVELELNIKDDLGNDLNSIFESDGEVEWIISSNDLGTITADEINIRKALFRATDTVNGDMIGYVRARVKLNDVTIDLISNLEIKDMQLAEIIINGPNEMAAGSSEFFTVTALSNRNIIMNLPIDWQEINPLFGSGIVENNQLVFTASANFIGKVGFIASALDPTYGHMVSGTTEVMVYQNITNFTQESLIETGLGCEMLLTENMLNGDRISTAKIYLYPQSTSPFEQVGVSQETISSVFRVTSNRVEQDFNQLPGLRFELPEQIDEDKISVAFWSENSADWQIVEEHIFLELEGKIQLTNIPGFSSNYVVLAESENLGIYDLQLRPNPFTPDDVIGFNQGLQIEFRLSSKLTRSPRITVKVYTINGQLVRTIVENRAMLKGIYEAGEINTLYWDGRTDNNRLARNGRYVIKLVAEDNKHREELVKTVILVK